MPPTSSRTRAYWVQTANPINCAGALAGVVVHCAHVRLAHGVRALNEKRMVEWAELTGLYDLYGLFAGLGRSLTPLDRAVSTVLPPTKSLVVEISTNIPFRPN